MVACLALFPFAGLEGYRAYSTPRSYLYVDFNPSLRSEINCVDTVIESYTVYLGWSIEDNVKLLELLTIGEIYEKVKADRLARQADKQRSGGTDALPSKTPKPPTETDNAAQQLVERRQLAIEHFTAYFGGSIGENKEKLTGYTIAQIYEAIKSDRAAQDDGR